NNTKQEYEKKFDFLKQEYEKEFEKYKKKRGEVESYIDKLVTAGLEKAYSEERDKYPKLVKEWDNTFRYSIVLLFICVSLIMGYSFLQNPDEFYSINNAIYSLLRSISLTLPLIWFAIYANKRRSEYHRLEQEYAHKAILAKSYLSYKEQIEKLQTDDPELLKKLMGSTIDTISYNPSPTLDKKHGDGTVLNEIPNTLKEILEIIKTFKK
ncbi:MAG: hypothetical protein IJM09_03860, partial [Neisseriaceae bacterium]|nr:hypothetical protein [Neisseriaceae bacterium]